MDVQAYLAERTPLANAALDAALPPASESPESLHAAMLDGRSYVMGLRQSPSSRWKLSPLAQDRSSRLRNAMRRSFYLRQRVAVDNDEAIPEPVPLMQRPGMRPLFGIGGLVLLSFIGYTTYDGATALDPLPP